jgi:hypothetical protein
MALLDQLKQHLREDDPTAQAVWDANAHLLRKRGFIQQICQPAQALKRFGWIAT